MLTGWRTDRGMHALAELVLLMSLSRVEPGLKEEQRAVGFHSLPGFHNQGLDSSYRALLLVRTAKVSKQILPWSRSFLYDPSWHDVRNLRRFSKWQFCSEIWQALGAWGQQGASRWWRTGNADLPRWGGWCLLWAPSQWLQLCEPFAWSKEFHPGMHSSQVRCGLLEYGRKTVRCIWSCLPLARANSEERQDFRMPYDCSVIFVG